jgi:hypothetical protein
MAPAYGAVQCRMLKTRSRRRFGVIYWLAVFLLVALGIVGIMSIGSPFLLVGLTLAALASFRDRPDIFWPVLAGVVFFIVGYLLVAPLACSTSAAVRTSAQFGEIGGLTGTLIPEPQRTVCWNLIGMRLVRDGIYNPSHAPALLVGLASALAAAWGALLVVRQRHVKD